jgi:DNA primase
LKGSIPEATIEEIRRRADIVSLIGEYVTLKKAGRNFLGLCPFHREKTPSFTVSPDKQMFYCFGAARECLSLMKFPPYFSEAPSSLGM